MLRLSPELVRKCRIERGMTQYDLADRTGIKQPLIARMESPHNERDYAISTLGKVLAAMQTDQQGNPRPLTAVELLEEKRPEKPH